MKTYLFAFAVALLCLTSCGSNDSRALRIVKRSVTETNKQLPKDYDIYTMDKMEVKEETNECVTYFTLDEEKRDFDRFMAEFEHNALANFSMASGNDNIFSEALVASGLNLKYIVTGKHSKEVKEIVFTADKLKQAHENKISVKDYLQDSIEDLKEELPLDAGEGMLITEINIEGDYLVYKVKNDESKVTMQDLEMAKNGGPALENGIIKSFNDSDNPAVIMLGKYVKQAAMGVKYIYYTENSNEQVVADVTPEMVKTRVRDRD